MSKLIMLSGWKGSGKDTVANYLASTRGAKRIAFADVLKDMTSEHFKLPRSIFDNQDLKEEPLRTYPVHPQDSFAGSVCDLLLGEFRYANGKAINMDSIKGLRMPHGRVAFVNKYISQLYWTPRAMCIHIGSTYRSVDPDFWVKKSLEKMSGQSELFVISDLRYQSEVKTIKTVIPDALAVRITRHANVASDDPSERDLDRFGFDHTLLNLGTLEELYAEVDKIIA